MEREKTHSQWNSGTLDKKKNPSEYKKKKKREQWYWKTKTGVLCIHKAVSWSVNKTVCGEIGRIKKVLALCKSQQITPRE